MAVTETVQKYQEILRKFFPGRTEIEKIDLLVVQSDDKTKIMILKVPTSLVNEAKQIYKQLQEEVSQRFPGYCLFIIRGEQTGSKAQAKKLHEKWLYDLSFPALIQERTTDYMGDEVVENVVLQATSDLNEKTLRDREFIFKTLTERSVKFGLARQ